MNILIATPVHEIKDYSINRWLLNVSKLLKKTPCDLLLVDNSSGNKYLNKLRIYLKKNKIINYNLLHLNLPQGMKLKDKCKRIEESQEFIRKYVITKKYDAWFSWECDQIIPDDSLIKLSKLMETGDFMIVAHNSWTRGSKTLYNMDMGITLINTSVLKKHAWQGNGEEILFKERVFRNGDSYVNVYGLLKPVYHLDNKQYLDDQI